MPHASPTTRAWYLAIVCFACACLSVWLGANYIPRLSNHAGYFVVDVEDVIQATPAVRPAHVTLIVVDGLRRDSAQSMRAVAKLADAGQCRTTDVGPYTVSRPIYALLSTGLEVDRSGARNNDETSALKAESVWDVAVETGLEVAVASHLSWWQELFPKAFKQSVVLQENEDVFAAATRLDADFTVIHPVYVDTAGHAFGAASAEYKDAVARVDGELSEWLASVDLQRDLVVFTADHGHVAAGGHGAQQPELRGVWVCFAGPGIARVTDPPAMDSRVVAPAIAVAMGLRFPKNMRAVEDNLDQLWTIFDAEALSPAYVAQRKQSVELFRDRNRQALTQWLADGEQPAWTALWRQGRRDRWWKIASLLAAIAAGVGLALTTRKEGSRQAALSLAWVVGTFALTCAVWVAIRGSFDYTSINERAPFLRNSLAICGITGVVAAWVHARIFRDTGRWAADQAVLALSVLALSLAHIIAFGWPLGFPVPHRIVLFFPFFAATFSVVHGLLACLASIRHALALRR